MRSSPLISLLLVSWMESKMLTSDLDLHAALRGIITWILKSMIFLQKVSDVFPMSRERKVKEKWVRERIAEPSHAHEEGKRDFLHWCLSRLMLIMCNTVMFLISQAWEMCFSRKCLKEMWDQCPLACFSSPSKFPSLGAIPVGRFSPFLVTWRLFRSLVVQDLVRSMNSERNRSSSRGAFLALLALESSNYQYLAKHHSLLAQRNRRFIVSDFSLVSLPDPPYHDHRWVAFFLGK